MRHLLLILTFVSFFISPVLADDSLVVKKAVKEIVLSGYTRSDTTMIVSSEVSGKVIRVNYEEGQIAGAQPFVEIDKTFIEFSIRQVRQDLDRLAVNHRKTDSRIDYLNKEYNRLEALYREKSATEVDRDAAKEAWVQAIHDRELLTPQRISLETRLGELLERKRRHDIHLPRGWILVEKRVESGEIVAPGTMLARAGDYSALVVPLSVSGEELAAIRRLPNPFNLRVARNAATATINWVNPEFNEQTRKLEIELKLVGHTGEKRGGLLCELPLEIEAEGFLVPKAAVTNRYDNPRVTIRDTGERINLLILGEADGHFTVAGHPRLALGLALATAEDQGDGLQSRE